MSQQPQTVKRYACIPPKFSRREFGALVAGGAMFGTVAQKVARASDPIFTVVVVPDPQYLAENGSCSGATIYNALIQWAIDNRNLVVGGVPLNIKGFIQVGDCQDGANSTVLTAGETRMANAYDLAHAANMFVAYCVGNHDYANGGSVIDRNAVGHAWKSGGRWSPANLAAKYGAGIDLGSGDSAVWGDVYTDPDFTQSSANNYIRLSIGSRKILVCSGEFYARSSVMNWFRDLHDTYNDHEMWFTTHGFLNNFGNLSTRTEAAGANVYSLAAAPASMSGAEQWGGASGWAGLTTLARNSLDLSGHFIYTPGNGWPWQRRSVANDSGRTVHQLFSNWQAADLAPATCGGTEDIAHLQLLTIGPTTIKSYFVSTNNGKWLGGPGVTGSSAAVELFNQPFLPIGSGGGSSPNGTQISGPVIYSGAAK